MKTRLTPVFVGLVLSLTMNHRSCGGEATSVSEKTRGSWITFLSHRTGGTVVYKMRPDGSQLTPVFGGEICSVPIVVEGVKLYHQPHWTRQSPNARYFASWDIVIGVPQEKWHGNLRAMLRVGGLDAPWCRVVNPDCREEFAWSPDSTRIAFAIFERRNGFFYSTPTSTVVVVVGIDGSNEVGVLEQPGVWDVCDWSPDGNRLVLRKNSSPARPEEVSDLLEFDLTAALALRATIVRSAKPYGKEEFDPWSPTRAARFLKRLLPGSGAIDPGDARYSPDGKSVAIEYVDPAKRYTRDESIKDHRSLGRIGIMDIATGQMKTITDYPDGLRGPICWSPDANEVLFSRYLPKGDDRERMGDEHGLAIWAIARDGTHPRFLTTGWSPDWR